MTYLPRVTIALLFIVGCGSTSIVDGGLDATPPSDSGMHGGDARVDGGSDAGLDGGGVDLGADAGGDDLGADAGGDDLGADAGDDAGLADLGVDSGVDACVATAELCDGLDNDCDGTADNGDPGGGGACSTGTPGVCAAGVVHCVSGALQCVPNVAPSAELCDGHDNDCNGVSDDGDPGGGGACSTGLAGVCAAGVIHCLAGALQCVQNVASSPELCDMLDNNCNGSVDEGDPGGGTACLTGMPGVCAPGVVHCSVGALRCRQNVAPSPEVCDGVDNNCNGMIDEGLICP